MTASERWAEALGYLKLGAVWAANYFTLTNLNTFLSTCVLLSTLVYSWYQIDKLSRERKAALRAQVKAEIESERGDL